ncbi:MAG: hypothetical protein U0528_03035 [Anaerolineae bacterium]|nr:hypothetical protein [Anaerolineae bacterium]
MSVQIETNLTSYTGSLDAYTFEASTPGPQYAPTNTIRTDQNWGVTVKWKMSGALTAWLNANFQIRVFLERMGPGADIALPALSVNTLSEPLQNFPAAPYREYAQNVDVAAGAIGEGVYRVIVVLHLFDNGLGNPTPVAGFVDCGLIYIFRPA